MRHCDHSYPLVSDPEAAPAGGAELPPFDLARLFRTVFVPAPGESVGVFTDLPDPRAVVGLQFLNQPGRDIQRHAYGTLYQGLLARRAELALKDVAFYAYEETGGSNLDLPAAVTTPEGATVPLREAFARHSIVLFMGRYSATAPATALAREIGNRGATMHGVNDIVVRTGYAVDYEQVSARAERLRRAMSRADKIRMEWTLAGRPGTVALDVILSGQEAQKSHGLVRTRGDIANLPAGEVYFVPTGCEGLMPQVLEDAARTVAVFRVSGCRIRAVDEVVSGDRAAAEAYMARIAADPSFGAIGELGFGTQSIPFAGTDIQDEKILGTAHLATGRSDHLGGDIGPKSFKFPKNASHNDILYAPEKTPEVELTRVTMVKEGKETALIERYQPSELLKRLL